MMMTSENMDTTKKRRGWCFTINNYTADDFENVKNLIENEAEKGIAEEEHINGEGTPHIQGYIYFKNARWFNAVKELLRRRAHIEPAMGNPKQNFEYCSKEGKVFIKKGEPGPTKRPFLEMWHDMKEMEFNDFEEKYPNEVYLRREKVMQVMIDKAMAKVKEYNGNLQEKNWWIWGEPGVGKSRWAASNGEYAEIYKKNCNKWWDGYNIMKTKIVILEDYPCAPQGNMLVQHMKIWGDRYPFQGECKGSHIMVEPARFFLIVTSNYSIDECFINEEDKKAIKRRFKEVQMVKGDLLSMGDFTLDRKTIEQEE